MWLWLALGSAVLLGFYDITKKKALCNNSPLMVLLLATSLSALFLSPCLFIYKGTPEQHLRLAVKGVLVCAAWVSGIIALKKLPITIVSPLKATRPFFVVALSLLIFGEKLNPGQAVGVSLALLSILLMSIGTRKDGLSIKNNSGLVALAVSIAAGVASALYDKVIIVSMEPLFVQSWSNVYISIDVLICILLRKAFTGKGEDAPKWDWMIFLTALLITGADALYFFALKDEGALLSVVSAIRRFAVVVTFVFGAFIFKEKNLRPKAVSMLLLLAGMVFLMLS